MFVTEVFDVFFIILVSAGFVFFPCVRNNPTPIVATKITITAITAIVFLSIFFTSYISIDF